MLEVVDTKGRERWTLPLLLVLGRWGSVEVGMRGREGWTF